MLLSIVGNLCRDTWISPFPRGCRVFLLVLAPTLYGRKEIAPYRGLREYVLSWIVFLRFSVAYPSCRIEKLMEKNTGFSHKRIPLKTRWDGRSEERRVGKECRSRWWS